VYDNDKAINSLVAVNSVFNSKTQKLKNIKVLNETVQYFSENAVRFEKKPDSMTRESRDMRWTNCNETPFNKPSSINNPGPQT